MDIDRLSGHVNRAINNALGRQITYGRLSDVVVIRAPFFAGGQSVMDTPEGPAVVTRGPEARVRFADLGDLGEPRSGDTLTVTDGELTGTFRVVDAVPDGTGMSRLSLQRVGD